MEFAYDNSYQASVRMAPYEALYGRPCRSPLGWTKVGERSITGPDLNRDTSEKVSLIRQRLLTAQSLQKIFTVAYRLVLTPSMLGVHEVFHVSILRKYTPDPAHEVDWGQIEIDTDGAFEEGPVCIVDSREQVLRRKTVRLVRVLWRHCGVEESTWEREDTMRATYPFLFMDEGTWFSRLRFK